MNTQNAEINDNKKTSQDGPPPLNKDLSKSSTSGRVKNINPLPQNDKDNKTAKAYKYRAVFQYYRMKLRKLKRHLKKQARKRRSIIRTRKLKNVGKWHPKKPFEGFPTTQQMVKKCHYNNYIKKINRDRHERFLLINAAFKQFWQTVFTESLKMKPKRPL